MTIEYLSLFDSWVGCLLSLQLHRLLHDSVISYPNPKVDKKFFKSWDLHIPHWLRDLLWKVRAWSSVASIFYSLLMSQASSSCMCSSQSLLKLITSFWHTFLAWMNPMILGGHSRWQSPLPHSSLLLWFEIPFWLHGLYILDLHFL